MPVSPNVPLFPFSLNHYTQGVGPGPVKLNAHFRAIRNQSKGWYRIGFAIIRCYIGVIILPKYCGVLTSRVKDRTRKIAGVGTAHTKAVTGPKNTLSTRRFLIVLLKLTALEVGYILANCGERIAQSTELFP